MGAPPQSAPRIFVSYSHKDDAFTQKLVSDLSAAGAEVWVDVEGITHGNFMQGIDKALARCEWMVLVLTPNAIESEYVCEEVYTGLNLVKKHHMHDVIPILATSCAPGTIPPQWDVRHRYDATQDYNAGLTGLLKALGLTGRRTQEIPTTSPTSAETSANDADASTEAGRSVAEGTKFVLDAIAVYQRLDFFDERLGKAFPGVRGLQTYSGREAVLRLQRLLAKPIAYRQGDSTHHPIWWWRGHSNMYIDRFEVLDEASGRCLLGSDELLIDTVAVYRAPRAYWSFVYVSARADGPTGVTPISKEEIERQVKEEGEAYEEVGYWNGRYVTRAEFDDGYAEIDGEVQELKGAEPRLRHLSDYNLFITSHTSVLNNNAVDETMEQVCEGLLAGSTPIDEVARLVRSMKLNERMAEYYSALE